MERDYQCEEDERDQSGYYEMSKDEQKQYDANIDAREAHQMGDSPLEQHESNIKFILKNYGVVNPYLVIKLADYVSEAEEHSVRSIMNEAPGANPFEFIGQDNPFGGGTK